MKYVKDNIGLVLWHYKTKGKKLTVRDVLSDEVYTNLVNLNEGNKIFHTIRNSPPYLQQRKK